MVVGKKNFDINRVRLTIGDARGAALTDKSKTLKDYSNTVY